MSKVYSDVCHAKHDGPAKKTVIHFCHLNGLIAYENPDRFGVDILFEDRKGGIQVEHKASGWSGHEFTWEFLNIPDRRAKDKEAALAGEDILICVLNGPMKRMMLFPAAKLAECHMESQHNKYNPDGTEKFFKIPVHKFLREGSLQIYDCDPQVEF